MSGSRRWREGTSVSLPALGSLGATPTAHLSECMFTAFLMAFCLFFSCCFLFFLFFFFLH
jgi:hypothetical protein